MKLTKSKLKEIIREEIQKLNETRLKEEVDTDKVLNVLYKNLKKFSKEQARTIRKLSRGQDIGEDLYDRLVGTKIGKQGFDAFLGEL